MSARGMKPHAELSSEASDASEEVRRRIDARAASKRDAGGEPTKPVSFLQVLKTSSSMSCVGFRFSVKFRCIAWRLRL